LQIALTNFRKGKSFGFGFQEHILETSLLPSAGIQSGATVIRRNDPADEGRYEVVTVRGDTLTVIGEKGQTTEMSQADVLVVKKLGEPVYPVLTHVASLRRAEDKASHVIINAENFHALQLLLFQHHARGHRVAPSSHAVLLLG
jgi:adenine-specific DNA-methyltransferase